MVLILINTFLQLFFFVRAVGVTWLFTTFIFTESTVLGSRFEAQRYHILVHWIFVIIVDESVVGFCFCKFSIMKTGGSKREHFSTNKLKYTPTKSFIQSHSDFSEYRPCSRLPFPACQHQRKPQNVNSHWNKLAGQCKLVMKKYLPWNLQFIACDSRWLDEMISCC